MTTGKPVRRTPTIRIRRYRKSDLGGVARLIFAEWERYLIADCTPEGARYWRKYLKPTRGNLANIAQRYAHDTIALVATDDGKVVGAAMGSKDKLDRLFVRQRYQGKGVGRKLMGRYELQCRQEGSSCLRVDSALHAVGFYVKMGAKKTTGVRTVKGYSFQPMKKIL